MSLILLRSFDDEGNEVLIPMHAERLEARYCAAVRVESEDQAPRALARFISAGRVDASSAVPARREGRYIATVRAAGRGEAV